MRVPLQARPGFTVTEMIISLTLGSIVIAILFGAIWRVQREYVAQRETRTAEEAIRNAEHVLRTVLASALADPNASSNALLDPDYVTNAANFNNVRVKSDFNPPDNDFNDDLEDVSVKTSGDTLYVKWTAAGAFQAMAFPVRSVLFEYFTSSNAAITTRAGVANAKTVRITIAAPVRPNSNTLIRRQTWVFLRNRRG